MADKKRKGSADKASRDSGRGDPNVKPAGSARKPKTRKPDEANGLPERSPSAVTIPLESPPEYSPSAVTVPLDDSDSGEPTESADVPRVENPDGPQGLPAPEEVPSSRPIEAEQEDLQEAPPDNPALSVEPTTEAPTIAGDEQGRSEELPIEWTPSRDAESVDRDFGRDAETRWWGDQVRDNEERLGELADESTTAQREGDNGFVGGLSKATQSMAWELEAAKQGTSPIVRDLKGELNRPLLGELEFIDGLPHFFDENGELQLVNPAAQTVLPDPATGKVSVFGRTDETDEGFLLRLGRFLGFAATSSVRGISRAVSAVGRAAQSPAVGQTFKQATDDAVRAMIGNAKAPLTHDGGVNMARIGGPNDVRQATTENAKRYAGRFISNPQDLQQFRRSLPFFGRNLKELEAAVRRGELSATQLDALRRGSESLDEIAKLAKDLRLPSETILDSVMRGDFTVAEIASARGLFRSSYQEIRNLGQIVAAGNASDAEHFAFLRQVTYHQALAEQFIGGSSNAGRNLKGFQIAAESVDEQRRLMHELLASPAGQSLDVVAKALVDLRTVEQLNAFIIGSAGAMSRLDLLAVYLDVRLLNRARRREQAEDILWNANSIRQLLELFDRPTRTFELEPQIQGTTTLVTDVLALSWTMRQQAGAVSEQGFVGLSGEAAEGGAQLSIGRGSFERSFGLLGVYLSGIGSSMPMSPEEFVAVSQRLIGGFGAASGSSGMTSLVGDVPDVANNNVRDGARAVVTVGPTTQQPFSTGFYAAVQRSPSAALRQTYLPGLGSAGGTRKANSARIELGALLTLVVWDMVAQGRVTGGGPADARLRASLSQDGWQPYSIKVGDAWVSYGQDSLLGGLIAAAADSYDIVGQLEDEDAQDLFVLLSGSFGQRLGGSAWMDSFAAFTAAGALDFDAMSPEEQGSLLGELERASQRTPAVQDPVLRDTRDMLGEVQKGAPGYSDALPPSRNIWGEPVLFRGFQNRDAVSPFEIGSRQAAPLDEEMQRLGFEPSMPRQTLSVNGVNVALTPQEHDRLVVLAGNEVKDPESGVGLRDALAALIETEAYKNESDGPNGGRAWLVREVIQQYQALARAQLIAESGRLQRALQDEAMQLNEAVGQ